MALRTTVKVGNVTNLTDARYAAGMEVNYVGFPLDGAQALNYETFLAITGWIEGVDLLGEFVSTDLSEIQASIKQFNLSSIQIEGIANSKAFPGVNVFVKCSQAYFAEHSEEITKSKDFITAVVIEDESDELQNTTLDLILNWESEIQLLLGSGVNATMVSELLEKQPLCGLSLRGSEEEKPGFKDMDQLADILEEIEVIDY